MWYMPKTDDAGRRFYLAHRRTAGSTGEGDAREAIKKLTSISKEDASEWLDNWRWSKGRECPRCGDPEAYVTARPVYVCKSCKHHYTWSSGTLLASHKKNPQIYVAAITCASDRLCSANFFAMEVGMQSSAAVRLFQKIRCMDKQPPAAETRGRGDQRTGETN